MRLILILLLFTACSSSDPEPQKGCPQLRAEAEAAYKEAMAHPDDKTLNHIWYEKQALVFERRCP